MLRDYKFEKEVKNSSSDYQ